MAIWDVKGVWLDSSTTDTQYQDFFGRLEDKNYPGYIISHDIINPDSKIRRYLMENYGYDIKAQGYDRRAEYLKAIFNILDGDIVAKTLCMQEYGVENPLLDYIWRNVLRPYTTISINSIAREYNSYESSLKYFAHRSETYRRNRKNQILGLFDIINRRNQKIDNILCDSLLLITSLGGGTGTGFINPITRYVRSEERFFPIFALGVLTERGIDERKATEGRRNLAAAIALNDLLAKEIGKGVDALILLDNQILIERSGGNYRAINQSIFQALEPLINPRNYPDSSMQNDSLALKHAILEGLVFPPFLIPCYSSKIGRYDREFELVENALKDRLFPCDPFNADKPLVFVKGLVSESEIKIAVENLTSIPSDRILVYRKIGDSKREDILILLRNPYGSSLKSYTSEETLESRIHRLIISAIEYCYENSTDILGYEGYSAISKKALWSFFYGEFGFVEALKRCIENLEIGSRPIFSRSLEIMSFEEKNKEDILISESSALFTQDQINLIKEIVMKSVKYEIFGDHNPVRNKLEHRQ